MLGNPTLRAAILAGVCLLAIIPFFWWGSPSGHDFEFHMFSWMEVLGQWKHGILYPRWAALAHWGYGEARFLFYPPASWTLGAALGSFLPWQCVPGAYCWIVLMLAGTSMYRLAREWLPAGDALFAAVFYALNPYHLLIVYWRSAYAEFLAAALLPLLLLCLWRLKEPGPRPTLWLSLVLAAGWLTNEPAAVMIQYSAVGLAIVLAVLVAPEAKVAGVWRGQAGRLLLRMPLAVLLGAGLAAFYLVPAIYEQNWINFSQVMSPGVRPQDNFLFTTTADPDHNRFNLLVSALALAELCVLICVIWFSRPAFWFSRPTSDGDASAPLARSGQILDHPIASRAAGLKGNFVPWLPLSIWGGGSAVCMLSVSNLLWLHLPKFRFVQLPFRWLLCLNAALALLLTMATKRWSSRGLACALLLGTVFVAGYRLQPPWWDTAADIREMSNAVTDGSGYEGTDEYVPAGADAYELNKNLARVTDAAGSPLPAKILAWGETGKHFRVQSDTPQRLTVRLFNYPAWQVVVNGKPAPTETTDVTGLMVIPVLAGDNDVQIYFRRTIDRAIGWIVSLISSMVLLFTWTKRPFRRTQA